MNVHIFYPIYAFSKWLWKVIISTFFRYIFLFKVNLMMQYWIWSRHWGWILVLNLPKQDFCVLRRTAKTSSREAGDLCHLIHDRRTMSISREAGDSQHPIHRRTFNKLQRETGDLCHLIHRILNLNNLKRS